MVAQTSEIHSFMQAKRIVAKVGKDQLPQHLEIKSKVYSHAGDVCLGRMTESKQERGSWWHFDLDSFFILQTGVSLKHQQSHSNGCSEDKQTTSHRRGGIARELATKFYAQRSQTNWTVWQTPGQSCFLGFVFYLIFVHTALMVGHYSKITSNGCLTSKLSEKVRAESKKSLIKIKQKPRERKKNL